jgi:hypothetical protein
LSPGGSLTIPTSICASLSHENVSTALPIRTRIVVAGFRWRIAAASRTAKKGESEPRRISAVMRPSGSLSRSSISCEVTNNFWVRSNNCCPNGVNLSGGLRPSNKAAWWRSSSALSCCDKVGCATFNRRAARLMLPSVAIAWNARKC